MPIIAAKATLRKLTQQKHEGAHTLVFNERGLSAHNLKYSTERFYPAEKFKSITLIGETFRLCIGAKRMYIKTREFEVGAPEDFYKWVVEICEN